MSTTTEPPVTNTPPDPTPGNGTGAPAPSPAGDADRRHYLTRSLEAVAGIRDDDLRKVAFEAELGREAERRKRVDRWLGYAGALATLVTVAIAVFNYADAKRKDAEARDRESARPFVDMRRERYAEVIKVVGQIAAQDQDPEKLRAAKRRFWELYWADLTLVEDGEVETAMVELGRQIDPDFVKTPLQDQTLTFARLMAGKLRRYEVESAAATRGEYKRMLDALNQGLSTAAGGARAPKPGEAGTAGASTGEASAGPKESGTPAPGAKAKFIDVRERSATKQ